MWTRLWETDKKKRQHFRKKDEAQTKAENEECNQTLLKAMTQPCIKIIVMN